MGHYFTSQLQLITSRRPNELKTPSKLWPAAKKVFVDAARVCETKEPIHITFFIYSE
jgi:hypothetical protein